MITCPDCHAENDEGAKACHSCGRALPQGEASGAPLPPWLQQLKPETEEDVALEVVAAPAKSVAAASTDGLFAAKAPGTRPRGKQATKREKQADEAATSGNQVETASLIGEDDLPAWLRAFGETEAKQQTAVTDESWMVGAEAGGGASAATPQNLAESWQAVPRAAEHRPHSGAASVFAKPAERPAKPERVIAASVAPEPEPAPRPLNARPDLPRPLPAPRERGGMSLQRVALIVFLVALVIFLVVVGIFLIGPSL